MQQGALLRALQESEHRQSSQWIAALPSLPHCDAALMEAAAQAAVRNCPQGWSLVAPPALTFATDLMDAASRKNCGFAMSIAGDIPRKMKVLWHLLAEHLCFVITA